MSFAIGITGLPNVGKSTLFTALTQKEVDISNYAFCTVEPNVGIVSVPDQRLDKIAEIVEPEKKTPTVIKFVDIAGLVKEAHQGEGLGNQFLANIRECDAILEVIRAFKSEKVEHIPACPASRQARRQAGKNQIDPERDIDIIKTELAMKDLQTIERTLEKVEREKREILTKFKSQLEQGNYIYNLDFNQEEKQLIKELQFLTAKPIIYLFNIRESKEFVQDIKIEPKIILNIKLEKEISELNPEEKKEMGVKSHLDKLIKACYNSLSLITFYTITGGKETRAWTLEKGTICSKAGGVVHSDFQENFIKAQVISFEELMEAGSWKKAKESGLIKTVGKDYVVKDGDIIEFKV